MPVASLIFLKRSLVRHPLLWLAGFVIVGIVLASLALYHAGYRQHAIDITQTTIQTEDGREFGLYLPPKTGFTFKPFIALMYLDEPRVGAGIESFRFYSYSADFPIFSIPMFREFDIDNMAVGGGLSYDVNYNWALGATGQIRLDGEWILGGYMKWRF